ncbi:MAG: MBL fold metallo-hydrolase [Chloroflexi bacterium]|nr:MBL fold metallo-hydrolase [Chloroflexota bacterium]
MKEIAENVWHIDTLGYVNAYVWRWEEGLTLIDTGLPWQGKHILKAIEGAGFKVGDIREIIITHADFDHYGGLRVIREATGARVYVHAIEAMFFKGRWRRWPNLRHPLGVLYLPLHTLLMLTLFRIPRLNPDLLVVDGEELDNGLSVLHTPGHTPGHIALFGKERGVLFTGDALVNWRGKLSLPPAMFTPQPDILKQSIRKLARLRGVEVAAPGHGSVIREKAGEAIRAFAKKVAPPPKRRPRKAPTREGVPRQPKAKPTSKSG